MQRLGTLNNPEQEAKVFIREICDINPETVDPNEQLIAYQEWLVSLDFKVEDAPISFKIGRKTYSTNHILVQDKKIETLLNMALAYLYELVNLDVDLKKYQGIDNVAALFYREDWSKPFSQSEYFSNAMMFSKLKCKYSLWGLQKFNELIVILKSTYPILYQDNDIADKTDERKMYDMVNSISGDNVSNQKSALEVEIYRAFEWMENKKIQSIKRKLNNGNH